MKQRREGWGTRHEALFSAHQCIQQEDRESCRGSGSIFHVLQLLPCPSDLARDASDGSGNCRPCVGRGRDRNSFRREIMDLQKIAEDWDSSHLNAENPNAISMATISRALRERRLRCHSSEHLDQCPHLESRCTSCNCILPHNK